MTDGFEKFWSDVDEELAGFPARPVIEHVPAKSTSDFTGYEVRLSGLASYRLFGYFSVPTGEGPFPGLLELPRHGSVNHAPHYNDRLRYVVFTAMHRGQRLADSPFSAAYPGLFTSGIESPETWVYRSVVADCLRAAEFLAGRAECDPARIGVTGDDLALVTAARRPVFSAATVTSALLHDAFRGRLHTGEYPWEELNDLIREFPSAESGVERTLRVFDPAGFAADVRADVLLASPPTGSRWRDDLLAGLGDRARTYRMTGEDAADAAELDGWLAERLGVPALRKFIQ